MQMFSHSLHSVSLGRLKSRDSALYLHWIYSRSLALGWKFSITFGEKTSEKCKLISTSQMFPVWRVDH